MTNNHIEDLCAALERHSKKGDPTQMMTHHATCYWNHPHCAMRIAAEKLRHLLKEGSSEPIADDPDDFPLF